jgi:hypothetical protein
MIPVNQSEYFRLNRPVTCKFKFGDRIAATFNKIKFTGTFYNYTLVSEEEGPIHIVLSDDPIKVDGKLRNVIKILEKDSKSIKLLK